VRAENGEDGNEMDPRTPPSRAVLVQPLGSRIQQLHTLPTISIKKPLIYEDPTQRPDLYRYMRKIIRPFPYINLIEKELAVAVVDGLETLDGVVATPEEIERRRNSTWHIIARAPYDGVTVYSREQHEGRTSRISSGESRFLSPLAKYPSAHAR
jgi:hypothetical protein